MEINFIIKIRTLLSTVGSIKQDGGGSEGGGILNWAGNNGIVDWKSEAELSIESGLCCFGGDWGEFLFD